MTCDYKEGRRNCHGMLSSHASLLMEKLENKFSKPSTLLLSFHCCYSENKLYGSLIFNLFHPLPLFSFLNYVEVSCYLLCREVLAI